MPILFRECRVQMKKPITTVFLPNALWPYVQYVKVLLLGWAVLTYSVTCPGLSRSLTDAHSGGGECINSTPLRPCTGCQRILKFCARLSMPAC